MTLVCLCVCVCVYVQKSFQVLLHYFENPGVAVVLSLRGTWISSLAHMDSGSLIILHK